MPAALLPATVPHRALTVENPDRVVPLVPQIVTYLCGQCEVLTEVRLHPRAPIPARWPCRLCRGGAECTTDADEGVELIGMPATAKAHERKDHWAHVSERRTDAELERLLAARLALLRAGKLHSGPSHS
ncbi:RNA polymerase-binding protein RbpA [Brachybacterium sp. GU-2]|uniref:RNA polymerase-binding protein RbpA n=1 Tax=Brachybacterium sp. GU-2 TaxID=3069708 RepID=UPI00280A7C4B|nr:RNA polymerase-binding protein RbpA [Brachybacterium sp. GU-2]WME24432.1 RNA polymerase-binding protein RbpA [Brachybacterium sp. GU-2]